MTVIRLGMGIGTTTMDSIMVPGDELELCQQGGPMGWSQRARACSRAHALARVCERTRITPDTTSHCEYYILEVNNNEQVLRAAHAGSRRHERHGTLQGGRLLSRTALRPLCAIPARVQLVPCIEPQIGMHCLMQ